MKKLLKVILLLLFSVCSTAGIYAQRTVTGTVHDDNQQPVPSANVVLKGTQIGALTDSNGKFTINVPSSGGTLVISFIGFTTTGSSHWGQFCYRCHSSDRVYRT